jgi:broad specificity phosphatase PhoE
VVLENTSVVIFVRHGRAILRPELPAHEWPLDEAHLDDIVALRHVLPDLPIVCSDMRRAIDTARLLGEPTVDPRLAEVSREFSDDDFRGSVARYLQGDTVDGWEPQADALARIQSSVVDNGEAIYVSHGTLLTLYLASIVPDLSAMQFWEAFTNPDAWQVDGDRVIRLTPASP